MLCVHVQVRISSWSACLSAFVSVSACALVSMCVSVINVFGSYSDSVNQAILGVVLPLKAMKMQI